MTLDDLDPLLLADLLLDRSPPKKNLGQHFIIDKEAISRTIDLATENECKLDTNSHVLEIGPGAGSLTLELLRTGAAVIALEIDNNAVSHLKRVFDDSEINLEIQEADALKSIWPEGITHVISNIPYQISSPILEKIRILHSIRPLKLVILLVQEEFSHRMAMSTFPSDIGPLGLNLWLDFDVILDRKVPPNAFVPRPKVNSRIVILRPSNRLSEMEIDRPLFRIVTKHCFLHRRRKLRTLLRNPPRRISRVNGWHKKRWKMAVEKLFTIKLEGFDENWFDLRPDDLNPKDWLSIVNSLSSR